MVTRSRPATCRPTPSGHRAALGSRPSGPSPHAAHLLGAECQRHHPQRSLLDERDQRANRASRQAPSPRGSTVATARYRATPPAPRSSRCQATSLPTGCRTACCEPSRVLLRPRSSNAPPTPRPSTERSPPPRTPQSEQRRPCAHRATSPTSSTPSALPGGSALPCSAPHDDRGSDPPTSTIRAPPASDRPRQRRCILR